MCRAWGRFQAACQINEVRQGNRGIQKYSRWNEYNICTNPKRVSLLICYSLLHSLVLYQGVVWIQLQQSAYTRYLGVVRGHKTNMIFHITNFTPQAQAVWKKTILLVHILPEWHTILSESWLETCFWLSLLISTYGTRVWFSDQVMQLTPDLLRPPLQVIQ